MEFWDSGEGERRVTQEERAAHAEATEARYRSAIRLLAEGGAAERVLNSETRDDLLLSQRGKEPQIDAVVAKAHCAVVAAFGLTREQAALVDPALLIVLYHWAEKSWPGDGPGWLTRPNSAPLFGGRPPMEAVLAGEARAVIEHLRAIYWIW